MDGKLIREVDSNNNTIDFIYGAEGIIGINYKNAVYLFRKNVFGDVTHIYDTEGNLKAYYIYDAWGYHKVVNVDEEDPIGEINPIRYRSYYYDDEIGLYYLRARYYDPQTGRFILQDNINYLDPEHLSGLNLYAYCNDNPVMYVDSTGAFAISALIIGLVIGAAVGFGATMVADYADDGQIFNGSISAQGYVVNTLVGALIGAFTGGVGSSTFTLALPTIGFAATSMGTTAVVVGTTTVAVSGTAVVAGASIFGGLIMFAKDPYVEHLKRGMTQRQKEMFQREIEDYKASEGRGGKDNLAKDVLRDIAEWVKKIFK